MTQNANFKRKVRQYAAEHGLAYADARRRLLAERETAQGSTENKTVVPSEYFDELLADLEAPPEPSERVAAAARRLGGVVRQAEPPTAGDLVNARLSKGSYYPTGATAADVLRLRPFLDAANAPSGERSPE